MGTIPKKGKRIEVLDALQVERAQYVELRSPSDALLGNRLADGAGLYLFITPNGAKSWRFDFRYGGERRVLVHGRYPDLGLKHARIKHADARLSLAKGIDPAAEKKKLEEEKRRTAQHAKNQNKDIFRSVAEEWLKETMEVKRKEKPLSRVWKANIERWIGWANDAFGSRPLPEIEASDVLKLIKGVATSTPASAEFCRQTVSRIFNYGIRNLLAPKGFNPAEAVKGAVMVPAKQHRPKLTAAELPAFLADLKKYQGPESVTIGLQILFHCWTRKEELASASWSEIHLDAGLWSIPAARMKMKRDHTVPLTPQVVTMFRRLKDLAGDSPYVFPSRQRNKPNQPMGGAAFNYCLNTLGYKGRFGPHGVRATAASILADTGFDPEHIQAQLAHAKNDAYLRNTYLDQRRKLLEAWSSMLDGYAAGGATVIPIGVGQAA